MTSSTDPRDAIFRWLLGEEGDFPMVERGRLYGWRSELRRRLAALGAPPDAETAPTLTPMNCPDCKAHEDGTGRSWMEYCGTHQPYPAERPESGATSRERQQVRDGSDEYKRLRSEGWKTIEADGITAILERAAAPSRSTPAPQEQTAWLVALGSMPPQWWTGREDEWTQNVDGTRLDPARCAMRFARREDAERAIGWLVKKGTRDGCRAEEHLWL